MLGVVPFGAAIVAADLEVTHPESLSQRVVGLVICLSAVLVALGMGLSLRAGYVPYSPDSEPPTTRASVGNVHYRFDSVPLRVTGVVDAP